MLAVVDYQRPQKLYRYSQQQWLERSLTLGEFRLLPAIPDATIQKPAGGEQILPFKSKSQPTVVPNFLTLSMTTAWDEKLFDELSGADCCLIIHNPEEFGERIHRAVQRVLPNWAGIDSAITYGKPSPLGAAFSKAGQDAQQKEWLFAWRPMQSTASLQALVIQIGNIQGIAELRMKNR